MTTLDSPTAPTAQLAALPVADGVDVLPSDCPVTYLMPDAHLACLLRALPPGTRLGRTHARSRFGLDATYLDTPGLAGFRRTALRRTPRYEVRIGCLSDLGTCWLELLTRTGSGPVASARTRLDWDGLDAGDDASPLGRQQAWIAGHLARAGLDAGIARRLRPQLNVTLMRSVLRLPDGTPIVVDSNIVWRERGGRVMRATDIVMIHLRTDTGPATAQLRRCGYLPLRCSLYALGVALLHPELARQRWRRARRVLAAPDQPARSRSQLTTSVAPIVSRAITKTVSSPATVPITLGCSARSIITAR